MRLHKALILVLAIVYMFLSSLLSFTDGKGSLRPNSIWKLKHDGKSYTLFPIVYDKKLFVNVEELAQALGAEVKLSWNQKVLLWSSQSEKVETGDSSAEGQLVAKANIPLLGNCRREMAKVRSVAVLDVIDNVKGYQENSQVFSDGDKYLTELLRERFFKSKAFLVVPMEGKPSSFSPKAALELLKVKKPEIKPDALLISSLNRYEFRIEEREWTTPLVEVEVEMALIDADNGGVIWYNKYRMEDTRFNALNTTNNRKRKLLRWLLESVSSKAVDTLISFKRFERGD